MESGVTDESEAPKAKTIAETLDEAFPHYLAMGMTEEQYWDKDCTLVIAYRKAYKIKQDEINYHAWLQGLYVWKAIQTAPVTVNGFVPKGFKFEPYFDKPIDFTPEKKKPVKAQNEQKMNNAVNFMNKLAGRFNAQMQKQKEERLRNPEGKE